METCIGTFSQRYDEESFATKFQALTNQEMQARSLQLKRGGFTLIEVLIVVVMMAVLAATIIPQFASSTDDAKSSALKFNLHALRSQIEMYKLQHNGAVPASFPASCQD